MVRWRTGLGVACLSTATLFFAAGCPNGSTLLGELDTSAAPATEEDVYKTLASVEKAFDAEEDDALDSEDEPVFFGDDAEDFAAPTGAEVEVSEDSVAGDVANDDGERPVVQGTLAGGFQTDDESASSDTSGGVFRGEWMDAEGVVDGYLRGEFNPFDSDALPQFIAGGGRFRGKLVDPDGRFRGRMRGLYGHTEDGGTLFVGRRFDRHDRLVGVLKGHWDDVEAGGGTFAGRWAAFNLCGESEQLEDVTFAADDFGGATEETVDLGALDESREPSIGTASENENDDGEVTLDPDDSPLDEEGDLELDEDGLCIDAAKPHGFVRGWHRPHAENDAAQNRGDGVFRADWRSRLGVAEGHLVGHYEFREVPRGSDDADEDDDDSDGGADDSDEPADDASGDDADDAVGSDDADDSVDDSGDEDATSDDGESELETRPTRGETRPGRGDGDVAGAGSSGGSVAGNVGTANVDVENRPTRTRGVFYGQWFDGDGNLGGYVRGVFGQGPHGLGVFRGKYFDVDGNPKGVLRGRWDDLPRAEGGPMFGVWVGTEFGDESSTDDTDSTDDASDSDDADDADSVDDSPSDETDDSDSSVE